jgi:hypothetical protein
MMTLGRRQLVRALERGLARLAELVQEPPPVSGL